MVVSDYTLFVLYSVVFFIVRYKKKQVYTHNIQYYFNVVFFTVGDKCYAFRLQTSTQ